MKNDALGDRMKGYENVTRGFLMKKTPVIMRIDGRHFHTVTRMMNRPYDHNFHKAMVDTCVDLFVDVQGSKFIYSQSDEISILMTDWDKLTSEQWFGGNIQKIVSIGAAVASASFMKATGIYVNFDARVFNLPREEVVNYFIWRQKDAMRNSVSTYAQHLLGHHRCQNKSSIQLRNEMQWEGLIWDQQPSWTRQGFAIYNKPGMYDPSQSYTAIDKELPIFTQDRQFIERYLADPNAYEDLVR